MQMERSQAAEQRLKLQREIEENMLKEELEVGSLIFSKESGTGF